MYDFIVYCSYVADQRIPTSFLRPHNHYVRVLFVFNACILLHVAVKLSSLDLAEKDTGGK